MKAHYLQHVPFEGLGSIEPWLEQAGYEVSCTKLFKVDTFPRLDDFELLIVMGGPMSVNDETEHPWLMKEKAFIKSAIEAGKSVLGICLGAQLITNAMGGEVFQNSEKEIGWFPVKAVKSNAASVFQLPEETDVFHWHGETFSLPNDAILLAFSAACENQAFQIGSNVIGLQFHLETTPISAQAIVENCNDELVDGEYIQSEASILSTPQNRYLSINSLMARVLEYLQRAA
ncbi:MAG: type 1 glutamine amidotransferase [Gammaproteobacteria bacterium]